MAYVDLYFILLVPNTVVGHSVCLIDVSYIKRIYGYLFQIKTATINWCTCLMSIRLFLAKLLEIYNMYLFVRLNVCQKNIKKSERNKKELSSSHFKGKFADHCQLPP